MAIKRVLMMPLLCIFLAATASAGQTNATARSGGPDPDQSGRFRFLIGTTVLGLTVWGNAARSIWMDPDNDYDTDSDIAKGIGAYLLTISSSFLVPYFVTKEESMTPGMGAFALYGGYKGSLDGFLIYTFLTDGKDDAQGILGAMSLASIGELLVHYRIAEKHDYSHGKARLMNSLSLFGNIYAEMLYWSVTGKESYRWESAVVLAGGFLGYAAAYILFDVDSYAPGDYTLPLISATLGGLLPAAIAYLASDDPDVPVKAFTALSLGVSVFGMWLGNRLAGNVDLNLFQGNCILLGGCGGALVGVGLAYALGGDIADRISLLSGAIAAGTGMALVYNNVRKKSPARKNDSALQFSINPVALLSGLRQDNSRTSFPSMPVVTAGLSF